LGKPCSMPKWNGVGQIALIAILILLMAFALRIATLGLQSFWFDEGWSWHLARMPLSEMAATTAGDRSPLLYYALLGLWMRLAGESEFALRYFSLLADVVTIALTTTFALRLARAGGARRPGWAWALAPALLAASPMSAWYAQETRMYALLAALCLFSSYALYRWLGETGDTRREAEDGRRPIFSVSRVHWLAGWALGFALALHTHYYAIFLLPAHMVMVFAGLRKSGRPARSFVLALALVFAAFIPWLLFSLKGFAHDDGFAFPLNTVGGRMFEWLETLSAGIYTPVTDVPRAIAWQTGVMAFAAGLGLISLLAAKRWRTALMLAALAFLPALAAAVAVRLFFPYRSVFHPRYLIFCLPALVLLATQTFSPQRRGGAENFYFPLRLRASAVRLLQLVLLVVLGGAWLATSLNLASTPGLVKDDVRAATKHVAEAVEPGDLVIMSRDNYAVRYYWRDPNAPLVAAPQGLQGVLRSDAAVVDALKTHQPKRVRLMLWQDNVVDPQKLVESTLWTAGFQIGEYNFGQIRLPLYQIERPTNGVAFAPLNAVFDGKLELRGWWMPATAKPGDWFYVVLDWLPRAQLADYKVFVHGTDSSGQIRFQQDKLSLNALLPMSRWRTDEALRDSFAIVLPKDVPPGEYAITIGLYPPANPNARLSATQNGQPAPDNVVFLSKVRVQP